MKVFVINDYSSNVGGVENYLRDFLPMLVETGAEVETFYVDEFLDFKSLGVFEKIRYKFLGNKSLRKKLLKKLRDFQPDVIHIHNNQNLPAAILSTVKYAKCPVIQSIHDLYQFNLDYDEGPGVRSRLKQYFYKQFRQRQIDSISHFIVHSDFMRLKLRDFLPSISVSYIPLMMKEFNPANNKAFSRREKIILYSGRLTEEKGIRFLIDSFNDADFPMEYRLVIMGAGELEETVVAASEENERIEYVGYVEDIGEWYRKAAILVVPSVWEEPFGLVGIEGFTHGTAVIASDTGGIPEWCIHDQTGLLFQPGVTKDLIWKIKDCINNPIATEKRVANAYQLLRANFMPELHVKRMVSLYERLIGEGKNTSAPKVN